MNRAIRIKLRTRGENTAGLHDQITDVVVTEIIRAAARTSNRRSESSPEVLPTDVGFGVSQVLPVLVLLAYAPATSAVILEAALVRGVQANGTPVSADDVRLWFIDQPGPVSRATDLRMNDYGEIINWPGNFFGDPLTETARIAKAGLRLRRRRNTPPSLLEVRTAAALALDDGIAACLANRRTG